MFFPAESRGGLYEEDDGEQRLEDDDDEEEEGEEGRDDVMEVDQLIQEELGGWTEVKPHSHKKPDPKVHLHVCTCIFTPHVCARGKVIGRIVVVISKKLTISRGLGT